MVDLAAQPCACLCNLRDIFDRPYLPAVGFMEFGYPAGHGGFL